MKEAEPIHTHVEERSSQLNQLFDVVDERAIGGHDVSDLPPKYYRSWQIIGSSIVSDASGFETGGEYIV
jgi:hypothetical protein